MKRLEFNFEKIIESKLALFLVILILIIVTVSTSYYGSTDTGDYADSAKYFAGDYSAKIRSSHSYLFGFLHAPLIHFFGSFIGFKITSLLFLFLIIYSIFLISGRNKKALWLALLSPVLWYMAPWINPIQASALILLWAYYFIDKFDKEEKLKHLIYSGILFGLGYAIWDTVIFFAVIAAFVFLFNKKTYHFIVFFAFLLVGLIPRLTLDYYLFHFPFYTIMKSAFGTVANVFGGIYTKDAGQTAKTFANIFSFLIAIPFIYWVLHKKDIWMKNKKSLIFLALSLLLVLMNPQIRYVFALAPIILVIAAINIDKFSKNAVRFHFILSIIVLLLFIFPYILQVNSTIDGNVQGVDFNSLANNGLVFSVDKQRVDETIVSDINNITSELPNQTFIVGNDPDSYQTLAHLYWGREVTEFVSIQDYDLFLQNETSLYEKTIMPIPRIQERRQIWISGGISKTINDKTNYENITYAIGIDQPVKEQGFIIIKKYQKLYLSKKE